MGFKLVNFLTKSLPGASTAPWDTKLVHKFLFLENLSLMLFLHGTALFFFFFFGNSEATSLRKNCTVTLDLLDFIIVVSILKDIVKFCYGKLLRPISLGCWKQQVPVLYKTDILISWPLSPLFIS